MKVLVTGGAGFIGSITVKQLLDNGHDVVVYDSLINGHRKAVDCTFVKGCLSDKKLLDETFKKYSIEAVIHLAGFIEAGESMKTPYKFFLNNVTNGINLLEVMVANNVKKIVFSSSAAVYKVKESSLKEEDAKDPSSVYGETKLMFEKILRWYDKIYGIKHIALRYFNAAGSAFGLGEDHYPESHLIPLIIFTLIGKRDKVSIFGTDYPTKDGTCIRDYVHVKDLANAHVLALNNMNNSNAYNVGTGKGYSIKEVIKAVKDISGRDFKVVESERRAGDPCFLVADSSKIQKELGWKPEFGIRDIIKSALEWHMANPDGYHDK